MNYITILLSVCTLLYKWLYLPCLLLQLFIENLAYFPSICESLYLEELCPNTGNINC
jgi:hypothetical protein